MKNESFIRWIKFGHNLQNKLGNKNLMYYSKQFGN